MLILFPGHLLNLVLLLLAVIKVKVTNCVKVIPRSNCKCLNSIGKQDVGFKLKGILVVKTPSVLSEFEIFFIKRLNIGIVNYM